MGRKVTKAFASTPHTTENGSLVPVAKCVDTSSIIANAFTVTV
jgi:hypothetical protein